MSTSQISQSRQNRNGHRSSRPTQFHGPEQPTRPAGTDGASQRRINGRGKKLKLMDQCRQAMRSRHYSPETERSYCQWIRRFIYFHDLSHPAEMGEPEINTFLTHLAVKGKVASLDDLLGLLSIDQASMVFLPGTIPASLPATIGFSLRRVVSGGVMSDL